MIYKVFGVFDGKALAFLQPFFSDAVGSAQRAFGDECGNSNSPFFKHPGDYQLFELGDFDNKTGLFKALVPTRQLSSGLDYAAVVYKPAALSEVSNGSKEA